MVRDLLNNNQKLDDMLAQYYLEQEENIEEETKELKWELKLEIELDLELKLQFNQ